MGSPGRSGNLVGSWFDADSWPLVHAGHEWLRVIRSGLVRTIERGSEMSRV
ncbi:hypothetical protein B005_4587 [Nocardiopsis alba ATCC BAA-2165]|uniref:Uncharacterized protein n=1 Tax=Nocardiopsis alba (strain ATCC BAA-2165 / BE74) TaxID=1205910 RepID=J7LEX1_NOCAA|nr:hypothetical protein B005_4587 [Nocardiopsis alba ATCC BAA-2165]